MKFIVLQKFWYFKFCDIKGNISTLYNFPMYTLRWLFCIIWYDIQSWVIIKITVFNRIFLKRRWRFSWNGVWTLVILQYSHVVYTSLSILNCPTIPIYQGDSSGVCAIKRATECTCIYNVLFCILAIITCTYSYNIHSTI